MLLKAVVRHSSPRFAEETIRRFVVGAFGQFGFGQSAFEVAVEVLAPGVHFGPRHFTAFDREQPVPLHLDAHEHAAFAQRGEETIRSHIGVKDD
jgi:hypothetical protein